MSDSETSLSPFAAVVPALVANGFSPIPIRPDGKAPGEFSSAGEWKNMASWQRWGKAPPGDAYIAKWSSWPAANVGICGGRGVIAFDIDVDEFVEPILALLPQVVVAKKGRKGLTAFFRADTNVIKSKGFRTRADGKRLGIMDLISVGKQTVIPPSIHPDTGQAYEWTTPRTLLDTKPTDLSLVTAEHYEAVLAYLNTLGWEDDERAGPDGLTAVHVAVDGCDSVFRDLNDEALANLDMWVPKLGLSRVRRNGQGFRAVAEWRPSYSGKPLGKREFHVSFHRRGIVDYGDGEKGMTAIDVVMAARDLTLSAATGWLESALGHVSDAPIVLNRNRPKDFKPPPRPGTEPAPTPGRMPVADPAEPEDGDDEPPPEDGPAWPVPAEAGRRTLEEMAWKELEEEARIVYENETDTCSIAAKTAIEPKGLRFGPAEFVSWKPGTALDGGPLTCKLLKLAIRMVEPDVIESPLATSAAWCLSVSWNISVEALTTIPQPIDTSPGNLIPLIRGAIAQSATYKMLRTAEAKNHEAAGGEAPSPFFFFEPYRLPDPTKLPRREWLYGGHYLRRALSATVAPGGFGKSTLSLVEAVSMATGRDLLGHAPARRFRVLVWNGEETRAELARRVAGICLHYAISDNHLGDRLMLASGRDAGLDIKVTRSTGSKVEVVESVIGMLTKAITRSGADAVILDPLVSVHDAPENDNTAMQVVVSAMRRVAEGANCAIELVHHTRKVGDNRVKVDDSRGGSALASGTRSMRVLNRMTRDEARDWGVEERARSALICIDGGGKANYVPSGSPVTWFGLESIGLGNSGRICEPQDHVGVPVPWNPPPPVERVEIDLNFEDVRPALVGRAWREDVRSKDWIGRRLAEGLGLDVESTGDKRRLTRLVDQWIREGKLLIFEDKDDRRRTVRFVQVADAPDAVAPGCEGSRICSAQVRGLREMQDLST